jgi:alkylation response protein AidB-like acyl-CoA dehydrogenase
VRASTGPAGRWQLSGTKWHVPFAAAADGLLVLARTGDGIGLFLVDPRAPGTRIARQRTLTGDAQDAVTFDGAAAEPVGPQGTGWAVWSGVLQDGLILLAAQAAGAARRALEMAVEHAANRRQFGKPLGAFQAIAHYLADAATVVDGVQTLVWEAAWARDAARPVSRLAPMAKLAACDAFRDVTATAQQIFGGVGFTLDYDIQLYFRRAKQWQLSWCDARRLAEMVADDLLGAVT